MRRRLLIIESRSLLPAHQVCFNDTPPGVECDRIEWGVDLYNVVGQRNPDLLIVVALSATEQAARLMVVLQQKPLLTPVLAVIPDDAGDQLIRLASPVVDDFIFAPIRGLELQRRISRILGEPPSSTSDIDEKLIGELTLAGLIGRDPAFLSAITRIPQAARTNGPVLITGETGTGKELCARAIHTLSPRRHRAFIPVDCTTLPEHLFESELFGYVRGAFTGASSNHRGLVNLAEGGTLFLDEIDSLSLTAQSKLLRLIQERCYRPLGSERFANVNASIVTATNRELNQLVQAGRFRADLFFRLNVLRLELVPLRQRRNDIGLLARHFVKQVCAENGIRAKSLTSATLRRLTQYDWPGNVRELNNIIQRAVVFCPGSEILPAHIGDPKEPPIQASEPLRETFRQARSHTIESFERSYVEQLMQETSGNVSRAAHLAGKERRAFGRLVKRYEIKRPSPVPR
jgi:DNA-binding NtrC family response regulator